MKERPILFSGPMILAILANLKEQTRRVIKPQPATNGIHGVYADLYNHGPEWAFWLPDNRMTEPQTWRCPYGQPGDHLWIKETWAAPKYDDKLKPTQMSTDTPLIYRASRDKGPGSGKWRSPLFMQRWMSRALLDVTDIRAERVQDISEEDAIAEGVECMDGLLDENALYSRASAMNECATDARVWFAELWDTINAKPKPVYRKKQIDHYESFPWSGEPQTKEYRGKPLIITPNPWVWCVSLETI